MLEGGLRVPNSDTRLLGIAWQVMKSDAVNIEIGLWCTNSLSMLSFN